MKESVLIIDDERDLCEVISPWHGFYFRLTQTPVRVEKNRKFNQEGYQFKDAGICHADALHAYQGGYAG